MWTKSEERLYSKIGMHGCKHILREKLKHYVLGRVYDYNVPKFLIFSWYCPAEIMERYSLTKYCFWKKKWANLKHRTSTYISLKNFKILLGESLLNFKVFDKSYAYPCSWENLTFGKIIWSGKYLHSLDDFWIHLLSSHFDLFKIK